MRLVIKSGQLDAEIQGNPIEMLQQQLAKVNQRQDEDIEAMGAHVNDNIVQTRQMMKEIANTSQQEIARLQDELDQAVAQLTSQLLKNNKITPEIKALGEKVKKLSAMRKPKVITKTITKTVTKKPDHMPRLHNTIRNIKRVPIHKYPKSAVKLRQGIMRADKPVHSSDSDQIGKLNAVPRMPI